MKLDIDENEQQHIYSCLLVGATEFGKVKKTLAKLDRDDPEIDEQIALNAKLKRMFNPRAEEEARAQRDDAQLDLTELRAARLNRTELQRADMSDEEIAEWEKKGPWRAAADQWEGAFSWWIEAGSQREDCEGQEDAEGRAARYNRSIARREENEHVANEQAAEAAVAGEQEVAIVAVAGADQAD